VGPTLSTKRWIRVHPKGNKHSLRGKSRPFLLQRLPIKAVEKLGF